MNLAPRADFIRTFRCFLNLSNAATKFRGGTEIVEAEFRGGTKTVAAYPYKERIETSTKLINKLSLLARSILKSAVSVVLFLKDGVLNSDFRRKWTELFSRDGICPSCLISREGWVCVS